MSEERDDLPVIDLGPELMIVQGFAANGNPIVDVLQADGTYKTCHTEVIEQYVIEGPVGLHHAADGTVTIEEWDEED